MLMQSRAICVGFKKPKQLAKYAPICGEKPVKIKNNTTNGAVNKIYGRRRPHLLLVRSLLKLIMGHNIMFIAAGILPASRPISAFEALSCFRVIGNN